MTDDCTLPTAYYVFQSTYTIILTSYNSSMFVSLRLGSESDSFQQLLRTHVKAKIQRAGKSIKQVIIVCISL
jgi:hypothetical protein